MHFAIFIQTLIDFIDEIDSVTLHTDVGDIKIELFCDACPKASENFLALCASDYYSGCVFIRNIKGFIFQTGDEQVSPAPLLFLQHTDRGMVSMANNGPNANASQFFITYAVQPNLDLKYTLFARVIDGFDALDELEKLPVNPKNYRPHVDKKINGVTIHVNPLAT
ncbi:peptidyl-prolyl cis-trans isomerase-like 3 [Drosophila miranda]|uniref:peptidyl-prolyl cis-trans isomerase-like 3 n=1 Tax=Drosophila miranda TaxID=7229 RepID=UPI00143FAD88|nr:peptidyl-prolyl cis-trans isomerase-like 3 [Drosophila miranda]